MVRERGAEAAGALSSAYHSLKPAGATAGEPHLLKVEQTNSSIAYGHELIFKLFRRIEPGAETGGAIERASGANRRVLRCDAQAPPHHHAH